MTEERNRKGQFAQRAIPEIRFWMGVSFGDGCWEWQRAKGGPPGPWKYGQFYFQKRLQRSHRVAWMFMRGSIPEGLNVLHKCDNPICVKPDHLFLGTTMDNIRDMIDKGRGNCCPAVDASVRKRLARTRCKHGHPFTIENTYIGPRGNRDCRICRRNAGKKYYPKWREKKRHERQNRTSEAG